MSTDKIQASHLPITNDEKTGDLRGEQARVQSSSETGNAGNSVDERKLETEDAYSETSDFDRFHSAPSDTANTGVQQSGENEVTGEHFEHSVDHIRWQLLGGSPTLNCKEMAKAAQCSVSDVFSFWHSMGFSHPDVNAPIFTEVDRQAIQQWVDLIDDEEISEETTRALIRAQSHLADRLALWQFEALVQDYVERLGLDDTSARLVILDRIEDFVDVLQNQLTYAWRRCMADLLGLMNDEVGGRGPEQDDPSAYPLDRSMGFVDMVSYTRSSAAMGSNELAQLIQSFESTCRDVIIERGGRVVKTIGDAVLFVSHDLRRAADISLALVEECSRLKDLLPVRASLVHGNVVSRSGDIFGPPVNLAARLADVAPTGTVFMDQKTALDIEKLDPHQKHYLISGASEENLQGLGSVVTYRLTRAMQGDQPPIVEL